MKYLNCVRSLTLMATLTDGPDAGSLATVLHHNGTLFLGLQSVEEHLGEEAMKKGKPFEPNFRGAVLALDAGTGKMRWQFDTAKPPQTGASVWSGFGLGPQLAHTGGEVMDVFRSLTAQGQTLFMVSHNSENAALAHRVIHMRDGRIESTTHSRDCNVAGVATPERLVESSLPNTALLPHSLLTGDPYV